ncbi:MAG: radical SAM protein [Candidatus Diapherotrites archaeon]
MNIVLLNPPFKGAYNREVRFQAVSPQKALHPPIMLAYAAAVCIEEKHKVDLIDAPALELGKAKTVERVKQFKPELIVMLTSTGSVQSDGLLALELKELLPKALMVAVGVHATAVPDDTLQKGFDAVARGEYEYTVRDLAAGKKLKDVLGLSYKKGESTIHNTQRPLIKNLDELPFPARHLLPNEKYYSAIYKNPFTFILAGRGCPHQCIFCATPQIMNDRRYRMRSPENVVAELEHIKKNFPKLKSVLFNDDTLNVNKKHLAELCNLITERKVNLPWAAYSRVDTIDGESAMLMKKAGCFLVKVGFESGVDTILQNMKKGTNATTKQALKAAEIFRKSGIQVHGTFVFGMPGETKETMKQTVEFAKKLDIDFVQFSVAQPYPGTEFFAYLKKNSYLRFENWAEYLDEEGCIHPIFEYPHLKADEMEKQLHSAYKSYYLRPKYVLKAIGQRLTNPELLKTSLRSGMSLLKYIFS